MSSTGTQSLAALMAGPRALTLEQKRKKYPLEWAVRDNYELYLKEPTPQLEKNIYNTLCKLAEVVAIHRYGYSNRVDFSTLPHEVASSMFITIVLRRKEVFSWTNLTKKVVRDWVSNRIRAECYESIQTVDISEYLGSLDGDDNAKEGMLLERANVNGEFTAEDMIHFRQVYERVTKRVHHYFSTVSSLKNYVIAVQALNKVLEQPVSTFVKGLKGNDALIFEFYRNQFEKIISPIKSESAFRRVL